MPLARALAPALLAVLARADKLPLSMKFCTGGGCSSGCTEWTVAASGDCAPGTAGNQWVSSTTTIQGIVASDQFVTWQLYQDNATSHSCEAANLIPKCNASLSLDGGCHGVSLCSGLLTGSYQVRSSPEAWLIAIIVIFREYGARFCVRS